MTPNRIKKRLIIGFTLVCVLMSALFVKVGYIQVVHGAEYSKLAVEQQTKDMPISAKRGSILDRNGEELASSAVCYSVWARPAQVKSGNTDEQKEISVNKCVDTLAEILGMDKEEVRTLVTKEQSLVKVAKYLDKETADKVRDADIYGIEIAEDVKRHYPLGDFASQLLGSVTDDNNGLAGIELRYNQYLSGISGRWIKNTDRNGNRLSYGVEKYYQAEDGLNVVLTIDEIIQHYAEKSIDTVQQATDADKVMCLIMDPKTGDILAMAITPGYDPNDPRVPLDENEAAYLDTLTDEEKLEYWNQMWRNPIVSDVYEPGSTSKLLTTAMALEEGVTSLDDRFTCTHSYNVSGTILNCWKSTPHGNQNLVEAVGNSCNPVFIQLAQRIGIQKFYDYLELFGMTERTGIDYPGEAYPIIQNINTAGPVGLATMSYGQGIAVNMVQQLTAICSLGNGGKLMQPRLVKALTDSDGNIVQEFDTVEVRQVVSEKTASEMCLIMESVVSEGGGGTAKIPGYRIGGKTGTANKAAAGGYSEETYSSFVGMAPMDDPQIAILVVVDNPKGTKFGSQTAAPGAKMILEDTLRYLQIMPEYTQEELDQINSKMSVVPDVTNTAFSTAIGILGGASLNYVISPAVTEADNESDFTIVDQYPKAGEKLETGGTVYIYRE
ncbi:MAG: stage V sporulation protein D [Eubacteriales Family XIII. Incertae Sedis bacterium]|nr:MAG: stage V sporulation protein D [Clostridiales Family XIII bacterium]